MNGPGLQRTASTGSLDLHFIRNQFPILEEMMHGKPMVFLDTAASSQKPIAVIEAISNYYKHQHANVHRGVYALSAAATEAFEQAREATRRFINAGSTSEVIFTKGTTEGINLVAACFERAILRPGDEVLISVMEHHSNIVPWQIACEQRGATLKAVNVDENGVLDMENFIALLNDKTRIVALVHISNALGTINPVERIIAEAHARNIPVLLDGAQAVPHQPVDVRNLDVDFYAFSGHKMYGPTGIGVLYGKEEWLDRLPPYQGGGEMIKEVRIEKTEYNELPFKFEAGTPNIADAIGLHAAIEFLEGLDRDAIQKHEHTLLTTATEQLMTIQGLRIIGQAPEKSGVLSFDVGGVHPQDIGTLLDQQGIAVRTGHHCTEPLMTRYGLLGTTRASFGMYNTLAEVDRLFEGVQKAVGMLK